MSENGYQLDPTKCEFVQTEIEFMEHIISQDSVKPTPKVEALFKKQRPTSVKEQRSFLGPAKL